MAPTYPERVSALLAELRACGWFAHLGEPRADDDRCLRVDFPWMVAHHGFGYAPWGSLLVSRQQAIDRLLFDHQLLGAWDAIQRDFKIESVDPTSAVDDLLISLDNRYGSDGSYYGDTFTYPHELVEFPQALVTYGALERLVSAWEPGLSFSRSMLEYLREGFWPAGWEGTFPDGRLILW